MPDMLGRDDALGVKEALGLILESLPDRTPDEITIPIEKAFGRILSRDITAPEDLPGFARSSVDGYAVFSGDTFGATENSPAYITVNKEVLMGEEPNFRMEKGEVARIATGGMLPDGADSVLMLEHAQFAGTDTIECQRPVAPGENIVQKGEDVRKGDVLLNGHRRLRPHDAALLAGCGITETKVFKKPLVSIISTGDEVIGPKETLRPGRVRDMNSYNLVGLVAEEGGDPVFEGIIKDDYETLRDAMKKSCSRSSLVLLSGGSSVGKKDVVSDVVMEIGKLVFHQVAMKPGKPLLYGIIDGTPVFGIPGHPRAVTVCFDIFVRPVLRRLAGLRGKFLTERRGKTAMAYLSANIRSSIGREEHISVILDEVDGRLVARPVLGKSGLISVLARADGFVTVPSGRAGMENGEVVEVRLY